MTAHARARAGAARRSRCSSCPTAPASAPRRWATRCSSSSRTCASSGALIPFISTVEEARRVVAILDAAMDGSGHPAGLLHRRGDRDPRRSCTSRGCPLIDFFDLHMARVEAILGVHGHARVAARLHGVGDIQRYNARMAAVEYAIEHDDGQSLRGAGQGRRDPDRAVAVRQDADHDVPRPAARPLRGQLPAGRGGLREHATCPGRSGDLRRPLLRADHDAGPAQPGAAASGGPNSRYASLEQCTLRAAPGRGAVPAAPASRSINSSAKSVEEMSAVIMQTMTTQQRCQQPTTVTTDEGALMTANVLWFAELGLADLEQVGGKNASLGEMVAQPVHGGRAGARRVRHDRRRLPPVPRRRPGLAERISATARRAWTPTTSARLAEVGKRDPRRRSSSSRSRPTSRPTSATAYDAAGRRTTPSCPSRCAPVATAEDLPDASFAGQQETFLNISGIDDILQRDPRGVRLALQRPGDRLPGAPRLRPRRRGAVGGVQRMVRSDIGASGVHVHHGHRVRLRRRGVHHLVLRARRGGGAGRGQPGRVLRLQAGPARPGRPAILKRGVGGKATKMVYTDDADGRAGRRSSSTSTPAERARCSA